MTNILDRFKQNNQETGGFQRNMMSPFPDVPSIRLQSTRFAVLESKSAQKRVLETVALKIVILKDAPGMFKLFYNKPFSGQEATLPDCFSFNGVIPNPAAQEPQGSSCQACPQNKMQEYVNEKTGTTGKSKPCTDNRMVAIWFSPEQVKEFKLEHSVYALKIPRTSLTNFFEHVSYLEGPAKNIIIPPGATDEKGRPILQERPIQTVVTKITFDPQRTYPVMQFAVDSLIEDEGMLNQLFDAMMSPEVSKIVFDKEIAEEQEAVAAGSEFHIEPPPARVQPAPTPPLAQDAPKVSQEPPFEPDQSTKVGNGEVDSVLKGIVSGLNENNDGQGVQF